MAIGDRFAGLLGDPAFNFGVGLLSAGGPSTTPVSLGQGLARGTQLASESRREALEQQALQQEMEARRRRQRALQQLPGLLSEGGEEALLPGGEEALSLLTQVAPGTVVDRALSQIMPQAPASPFTKIDPSKFTPASVAQFQRTQDFSQLRPREDEPEPSSLQQKLQVVTDALGRDLTESEVLRAAGMEPDDPNADNILNQQIPPTQLSNVRMPDGSQPPVGTTWGQVQEAGGKVFSAADLKRQQSIAGALNTLEELERMALDSETGVFVDEGGSVLTNNILGRVVSGISNGLGALAGTEASERRRIFDATSRGVLSSLVRSLGESGALSDGDVKRAMELIPTLGATPTTERQARAQFTELRTIISRGQESLGQMQGDDASIDLGGGWTMREVQ